MPDSQKDHFVFLFPLETWDAGTRRRGEREEKNDIDVTDLCVCMCGSADIALDGAAQVNSYTHTHTLLRLITFPE